MTDHPDLARLLKGILASPEEDGPRLAWADRLAELGDGDRAAQERAEFVKVQCELANGPGCFGSGSRGGYRGPNLCGAPGCRYCALRRRERDLLIDNYRVWYRAALGDLADHVFWGPAEKAYRRGFVEWVTCSAAAWLTHADAVLAAQPVTAVTLTTDPDNDALHLRWSKLPGRGFLSQNPRLPAENDHRRSSWALFFLGEVWSGVTFTLPPAAVPTP